MPKYNTKLYNLSTGKPITSLSPYSSPIDEYCAAFDDQSHIFLNYYTFQEDKVSKLTLTRGEFWDLACSAATYISKHGISKGDRVVHSFSYNSLYDLVFRLAAVLVGCTPVTVNWQTDDNERIIYKAVITSSKLMLYDNGFAGRVEEMKSTLPTILFLEAEKINKYKATDKQPYLPLDYADERMVIFTSGTTAKPKGVSLSHRSYLANSLTFEHYFGMSEDTKLDLLLVNPLHHTNSTALSDWGMRRKGAVIHLLQRYTTAYWKILVDIASTKRDLLITSLVSRHIDFLEDLSTHSKLQVKKNTLQEALNQTDILIGSAPVGPTTIRRILNFSKNLPHVRFGSTEACLQVIATPKTMPKNQLMRTFQVGWSHRYKGKDTPGYYIGREHFPFTRVKVVKAIDPKSKGYFQPCEIGEPGYLITQGANIMNYYIGDDEATKAVFREGWYTGLRDIVFALKNKRDGDLDYYWISRDSELLIRGGANYAYDQIAAELSRFLVEHFSLKPEQFQLAVVGLRLKSEHEDSCCVTIQLSKEVSTIESELKANFIEKAPRIVSKGSRPDYLRFGQIPKSFKGAILYPQLKQDFWSSLKRENENSITTC
ncbi:AMP-binding protein [Chloroflexota bacterium]